jgi:hypothetical protein
MPVWCKYIVKRRSYGWYLGIIDRIVGKKADIEYDDGTYDYDVAFKNLQFMGKRTRCMFEVDPLPAPKAIVLSIPHAYEAVAEANRLVQAIEDELKLEQDVSTATFSTPPHSTCSTPPPGVLDDDDDEVVFVMEKFGTAGGSADRPIVV